MKFFIVLALFAAAAVAAPADKDALVTSYSSDNIGVEGFRYGYETSNGIAAQEEGVLKNPGSETEGISVRGSYSYPGPDGILYAITYLADENGFQPSGAHLPKP